MVAYVYKYIINISERFILGTMENSNITRKQTWKEKGEVESITEHLYDPYVSQLHLSVLFLRITLICYLCICETPLPYNPPGKWLHLIESTHVLKLRLKVLIFNKNYRF